MPRKIKDLKHIYQKDKRCLSLLARAGSMSAKTFNQLEISKNRIKSYQEANLISKTFVPSRSGNGGENFYILTAQGKDFCRTECGVRHFISNGNSTYHNSKVSEQIANTLTKKEIDSCLCERELDSFIQDRLDEYYATDLTAYYNLKDAIDNHTLSMPDIVYTSQQTGSIQAVEIVTNNYKENDITAKEHTAELLKMEISVIHTREV